MKKLNFEDCYHMAYGDYGIDWPTERKFKQPCTGLRAWEGGRVHLMTTTERDSGTRDHLMRSFGIDVRIKKDLPTTLYIPHTDRRITRPELLWDYYLVDHQSNRVFSVDGPARLDGGRVSWARYDAIPVSANDVRLRLRNKAREKEMMAKYAELFTRAKAIYALEGRPRKQGEITFARLDAVMLQGFSASAELLNYIGTWLHSDAFTDMWRILCSDHMREPHLTLKPFGL